MKIMEWVKKLTDNNEDYESTFDEIRKRGRASVKPLYAAHFSQEGEVYTHIYHLFAAIGDDLVAAEGVERIEPEILKAMRAGAKKSRQWAGEEVYNVSIEALDRWGIEVPPVMKQAIHSCHICGKKITEERVMVCGLHSCDNAVCREHSHIIETRFGKFDGSGGAWFCSKKHHTHADQNHIDWN